MAVLRVLALFGHDFLCFAVVPATFVVANRTLARATELAGRFGARAMSLDEFRTEPPAIEALLSATGAATPHWACR